MATAARRPAQAEHFFRRARAATTKPLSLDGGFMCIMPPIHWQPVVAAAGGPACCDGRRIRRDALCLLKLAG